MDVVEVAPTAVGSADTTALVADRIVREVLTGVALRRTPRSPVRAPLGADANSAAVTSELA